MLFNFQSNYYVKNVWKLLMCVSDLYFSGCEVISKRINEINKKIILSISDMSDPDCFCPDILSGDCLKIILSLECCTSHVQNLRDTLVS